MKKIILIPVFLLLSLGVALAASNKSTIRFRLSDGDLIRLVVNNRYYNKTARAITVGDIPGKKQNVKVYRFRPYANKAGGKATLIFEGKIKIEKGKTYDAVIDAKTNQLYLTKVNKLQPVESNMNPPQKNQPLIQQQEDVAVTQSTSGYTLAPGLEKLKNQMDSAATDGDMLKLANDYVANQSLLPSEDVRLISGWLLFDDTRLQFLKKTYPKVSDPEDLDVVLDTFTEDANKAAFQQFLKSQK